jgi:hypothetical protein
MLGILYCILLSTYKIIINNIGQSWGSKPASKPQRKNKKETERCVCPNEGFLADKSSLKKNPDPYAEHVIVSFVAYKRRYYFQNI